MLRTWRGLLTSGAVILLLSLLWMPSAWAVDANQGYFKYEDTTNDVFKLALPGMGTIALQNATLQNATLRSVQNRIFYGHSTTPTLSFVNANNNLYTGCGITLCVSPSTTCSMSDVFVSAAGALDGFQMYKQTMTGRFRAYTVNTPQTPAIIATSVGIYIYHQTSGGTNDVLLGSKSQAIGSTELGYTFSIANVTQAWTTNEKVSVTLTFSWSCPGIE